MAHKKAGRGGLLRIGKDSSERRTDIIAVYGYIRVSTREQNEDRQRIALREAGVPSDNVFMDKQSGKDFARPQYKRLFRRMKKRVQRRDLPKHADIHHDL